MTGWGIFILGATLLWGTSASGQIIRVNLDLPTTEDRATNHLEPFMTKPPVRLTLPQVDTSNAQFMVVFYTYGHGDPYIYIMILAHSDGELLYIDRNYDHNLANDGPPELFSKESNEFSFDIASRDDSLQITRFLLLRNANMIDVPDSVVSQRIDSEGNLTPAFVQRAAKLLQHPEFRGQRGTFYWDDRVNLRRGRVHVDGKSYTIGLLDGTNNGRFDDDSGDVKDLLIVDRHSSGRLMTYDASNVFKLTDVISLGNERYKISAVDKYGRWIELKKTDEALKFTFFEALDSSTQNTNFVSEVIPQSIRDSLWNVSFQTIDNSHFSLNTFRGKYILLNFWGEWCKPCLEEIPSLVKIVEDFDTSKVMVVSFLQAVDMQKARQIILEKGMRWNQVLVTQELEEQCQIIAYPTNILLFPNGKNCIRKSSKIDVGFLARYVQ